MGFFKEIGKFAKNVGKAAKKVAPIAGVVGGTLIGGPAGAAVGGQIGGLIGSIGGSSSSSSVPEVSSSYGGVNSNLFQPGLYTPGFSGGVTVRQDGSVDFGGGRVVPPYVNGSVIDYSKQNGKIFGSPSTYGNGSSSNNAAPLLFGVGALLLLSD